LLAGVSELEDLLDSNFDQCVYFFAIAAVFVDTALHKSEIFGFIQVSELKEVGE